jgi:DNA polymerase elongation subunit (family B)
VEFELFETSIDAVMRFTVDTKLTAAGWVRLPAQRYQMLLGPRKQSTCSLEVSVRKENLVPCDPRSEQSARIAPLCVLAVDLVASSGDGEKGVARNSHPSARDQICCVSLAVAKHGTWERKRCLVLTLGPTEKIRSVGDAVEVKCFHSERDLLRALWRAVVHEIDPDVVVTFQGNLLGAVLDRASSLGAGECRCLGRIQDEESVMRSVKGAMEPFMTGRVFMNLQAEIQARS